MADKVGKLDDPAEVLRRVTALVEDLEKALKTAKLKGDARGFVALSREVRELLTMCAKVSGLMTDKVTVQITSSPIFAAFVSRVGETVVECPTCGPRYEAALIEAAKAGGK